MSFIEFHFSADVQNMATGDEYLAKLFHDFVEMGGDTLALQVCILYRPVTKSPTFF